MLPVPKPPLDWHLIIDYNQPRASASTKIHVLV
jgi:hypothetical protein